MAARKNVKLLYDTMAKLVDQAEAQAGANQPIDNSIIEALTQGFEEIIEFEKCYLIQCQDRFWGNILMSIDCGIDFKQRGAVDLKIDRSPFFLGINPMFCAKFKFPEFTGLIITELTKMVYLHPASYASLNHEKDPKKHKDLEKSSSAAATSIVKSDIRLATEDDLNGANGCRLPNGSYTPTTLNDDCGVRAQEKEGLEYYFNILNKFKDKNPDRPLPGYGMPGGMPGGNPNGVATQNNNDGEDCHQWEGSDKDEMKEQITSLVSEAYNSLNERSRGFVPSSIQSQIKKLLAPPEINWKQVLAKMVGSIPVPYRKTRTRLNRRQPYRADLCGKLPKRTVNIICCFDTSGSVGDDELMYCMNEVFNILKTYEGYKITLLECDAEVQRVYQVHKIQDVKTKMCGRGGTSFIPAIEYINGEGQFNNSTKWPGAGKYRDALMVYFTDGFGDSEIPKPKTYRNLWVVLNDVKNLSLKNPYGDVKSLSTDEAYKKFKGLK